MEAMSDLLQTAKDCGGNPNATTLHPRLDENVESVKEAIQDLTTTLDMAPESGLSTSIIEAIQKSRGALGEPHESTESENTGP